MKMLARWPIVSRASDGARAQRVGPHPGRVSPFSSFLAFSAHPLFQQVLQYHLQVCLAATSQSVAGCAA